jgi:hypothetical protein
MNIKLGFLKVLPFIFLYFLLSCKSKNHVTIPTGIVVPDTMIEILSDVHLLQASAQLGYSQNTKDTTIQLAYQSLWKKHNLTESSYNEDMQFYCDHPRLLDSVYEKVLSNLNRKKAELMGPTQVPGKEAK